MGDLPLARRQADENLTIIVDAHRGWRQPVAETVGNELRLTIAPYGDRGVRGSKVNADHRVPSDLSLQDSCAAPPFYGRCASCVPAAEGMAMCT